MGFWGSLGKGLLKVAPYAAMAIPGVGVPLGIALQAGLGAANAAASGGGLKGALVGAGLGAAGGAAGGLGGSLGNAIGGTAGKAVSGALKGVASNLGSGAAGQMGAQIGAENAASNSGGLSPSANVLQSAVQRPDGTGTSSNPPASVANRFGTSAGYAMPPMGADSAYSSSPNLGFALQSGAQQAIRNQPFRQGSTVTYSTGWKPNADNPRVLDSVNTTSQLPRIYSGGIGPTYNPRMPRQQAAY